MLNITLKSINKCKVLRISSDCLACCDDIVCPEVLTSLTGTITVPGYTTTLTITPTDDSGIFSEDFDVTDVDSSLLEFPNGVYKVDYVITPSVGSDILITKYYPVICGIEKCFSTILAKTKDMVGDPKKEDCLEYILNAYMQKEALRIQILESQDDVDSANAIISYLQEVCENKDCECYG